MQDRWNLTLHKLSEQAQDSLPRRRRFGGFNPRPSGILLQGSTSSEVMRFLHSRPADRFWARQIVAAVGRSPKTVSWSLVYLQSLGFICSRRYDHDVRRNIYWLRPDSSDAELHLHSMATSESPVPHPSRAGPIQVSAIVPHGADFIANLGTPQPQLETSNV